MNPDLFVEILAQQRILALKREAAGVFRLLGRAPAWCTGLLPEAAATAVISPAGIFSFMEHFLSEAEPFWAKEADGELPSDFWIEEGSDGSELHLLARACFAAGEKLLLIRRFEREFDELQRIHQRARTLLLANEQLLTETSKKEILLHCIIHDLAGPLSSITGTLEVLKLESALSERGAKFLAIAQRATRQQSLLIDDLLATFRSELGTLETLDPDPKKAPDLIKSARNVLDALSPALATRDVKSRLELEPDTPNLLRVRAEASRLERVFHNLLQNALRYSPAQGTIKVGLRLDGAEAVATIDDEGPGISPAIAGQLFQKFARGGDVHGKAGLGLYFCRISIKQWGGTIGCEPRPEGGTRFWFRLAAAGG